MRMTGGEWLYNIRSRLKQYRRRITYSEGFVDFFASLATLAIILYTKTLKIKYYHHPEFLELENNKFIFGFWHGIQFVLVPNFGSYHNVVMTDVSWAGEIQTKILIKFGYIIVRGSSKRKGVQALLNMKKALDKGFPGGFALDGPRGPIHKSKPGILFLARKLNYPIVPLATASDRCWILRSTWCKYVLPKPFSRCYVAVGRPIRSSESEGELLPEELDRILLEWTAKADQRVGTCHQEKTHGNKTQRTIF